jgi:hypothetical protein
MKRALLANLGRALAACLIAATSASAQESPAPQPKPDKLVVHAVDVRTKLEAGRVELKVGDTDGQVSGSSFTPAAIDGLVVAAVVFEDYTFEGDAESAAHKVMMDEGSRLQLPPLLQLLRDAHAADDAETAEAVRRFRAALNVLDDTAPQTSVGAVLAAYPALPPSVGNTSMGDRSKGGIEVSMHYVRTELLKDLGRFEEKFQTAPADNSFKLWLAEQQARYENWLARL